MWKGKLQKCQKKCFKIIEKRKHNEIVLEVHMILLLLIYCAKGFSFVLENVVKFIQKVFKQNKLQHNTMEPMKKSLLQFRKYIEV